MSHAPCRDCGAAVPEGAQWCTLCFADLRPPPPVIERATLPSVPLPAAPTRNETVDAAAMDALTPQPESVTVATATATINQSSVFSAARWPCPRCGAQVPIAMDMCNECGAGFLAAVRAPVNARLPVVGDVTRLSSGQRLGLAAIVSVCLIVLFIVAATVLGAIF